MHHIVLHSKLYAGQIGLYIYYIPILLVFFFYKYSMSVCVHVGFVCMCSCPMRVECVRAVNEKVNVHTVVYLSLTVNTCCFLDSSSCFSLSHNID